MTFVALCGCVTIEGGGTTVSVTLDGVLLHPSESVTVTV